MFQINKNLVEYAFKKRFGVLKQTKSYQLVATDVTQQFMTICHGLPKTEDEALSLPANIYQGKLDNEIDRAYKLSCNIS